MQHAGAARRALFYPNTPFFENSDESSIESCIDRFMAETFGDGLYAGAASERKYSIISFDCFGGGLYKNVVALRSATTFL